MSEARVKNIYPHDFVCTEIDAWGNKSCICPICGFTFKEDGMVKHMIRLSQKKDALHTKWLKENRMSNVQKKRILKFKA